MISNSLNIIIFSIQGVPKESVFLRFHISIFNTFKQKIGASDWHRWAFIIAPIELNRSADTNL